MKSYNDCTVRIDIGLILAGVVIILAVMFVGEVDRRDAQEMERTYCESVADGVYPDYKEIFDTVCKEKYQK